MNLTYVDHLILNWEHLQLARVIVSVIGLSACGFIFFRILTSKTK